MMITGRCFTFGIGSGALTALVRGITRAGNGSAEFIADNERMQSKVSSHTLILVTPPLEVNSELSVSS